MELPDELALYVVGQLDVETLLVLVQVNQFWRRIVTDASIWKNQTCTYVERVHLMHLCGDLPGVTFRLILDFSETPLLEIFDSDVFERFSHQIRDLTVKHNCITADAFPLEWFVDHLGTELTGLDIDHLDSSEDMLYLDMTRLPNLKTLELGFQKDDMQNNRHGLIRNRWTAVSTCVLSQWLLHLPKLEYFCTCAVLDYARLVMIPGAFTHLQRFSVTGLDRRGLEYVTERAGKNLESLIINAKVMTVGGQECFTSWNHDDVVFIRDHCPQLKHLGLGTLLLNDKDTILTEFTHLESLSTANVNGFRQHSFICRHLPSSLQDYIMEWAQIDRVIEQASLLQTHAHLNRVRLQSNTAIPDVSDELNRLPLAYQFTTNRRELILERIQDKGNVK